MAFLILSKLYIMTESGFQSLAVIHTVYPRLLSTKVMHCFYLIVTNKPLLETNQSFVSFPATAKRNHSHRCFFENRAASAV